MRDRGFTGSRCLRAPSFRYFMAWYMRIGTSGDEGARHLGKLSVSVDDDSTRSLIAFV